MDSVLGIVGFNHCVLHVHLSLASAALKVFKRAT